MDQEFKCKKRQVRERAFSGLELGEPGIQIQITFTVWSKEVSLPRQVILIGILGQRTQKQIVLPARR